MRVVVEAAFGYSITAPAPVWTDITEFADLRAGLTITRGSADEIAETQAGTLSLTLDNSDGRFTPGRAASPYYPNVRKNTPIRVGIVTTAKNLVTNPAFETNTADWSATGTPTPSLARSTVRAQQGTASLLVTWGTGTAGSPAAGYTLRGLHIGTVYTASAYVWVPAGHPAVRLAIGGVATGTASTVTGAWQRITMTWTATAPRLQLRVEPAASPTSGQQVWVDSVQVEDGASATAFDPAAAELSWRIHAMVGEWPVTWKGLQSTVTVTGTDTFKWLSQQPELQAMLVEEMLLDQPLAYYPLSEPAESTSAGDLSGYGAGSLAIQQAGTGGTLTFAAGAGPTDGLGCPILTPASSTAGKYLLADLGQHVQDLSAAYFLRYEAWFTASTDGRVLMSLASSDGTYQLVISLESGTGKVKIETTQVGGTLFPAVLNSGNLADGGLHHLVWDDLTKHLWIDGVNTTSDPTVLSIAAARILSIGGHEGTRLWSGRIAHAAVYVTDQITAADLAAHYATGTTGYTGESASTRAARLAGYVGLGVAAQGSTFTGMAPQWELGRSPLEHLREVERTESGKLLASRSSYGLVLQSRDLRYNPTPTLSLDYADLETDSVEYADDDQKAVNIVTASRPGGATQRLVDQASRDAYGPYPKDLTVLKTTDNEVLDAANWLISRYADPPPEIRQIPVEAYSMPLATYRALLAADVSTALSITGLPPEAPSTTATVTVEGYTETIGQERHLIDFHVSRSQTDSVWVLNSAAYSVLGSTTRLAY
jgi:hypothetical protein